MKQLLLVIAVVCAALTASAQQVIVVQKGDAQSLLNAIDQANKNNASTASERIYIFVPDGLYDLGKLTLTRVSGHNIAVVGQSMEGTIIRNAPDVKDESISKTAVLQNRGTGNYFQDLTLKNDLDYYSAGEDGRGVCLQDKGTRTICNRVRMLSFQDTYYSDNDGSQHYMQDTEIHGTIDFICGTGDVWFERCLIFTERRHHDGSGRNIIVAARTSGTQWGYVFNRCTIQNDASVFHYGRSWHTDPHSVWLYTKLLTPEKLLPTRFDPQGMKIADNYFKEYGTMDASGRDITPKSNVVTFTLRDNTKPVDLETIMTKEEARRYTLDNVFGDWHPDRELKNIERTANKLKNQHHL
jgi:hypothetical protein